VDARTHALALRGILIAWRHSLFALGVIVEANMMSDMSAVYRFDRSKPFYPLVMNYLSQLHALKELLAIGVLGLHRTWDSLSSLATEEQKEIKSAVDKLLGPLSLRVTDRTRSIESPVDQVAKELAEHHAYLLPRQAMAAMSVLVMAHEISKSQSYRTSDPTWEFLRHCRNAAAHNGRWSLVNGEPRRPASWRSITLSAAMDSTPLLKLESQSGALELGDPIALLWDIEQANPAMCA